MNKVMVAIAALATMAVSAAAQAATFDYGFTMNASNGDTYVGSGTFEADSAGDAGGRTLWSITDATGVLDIDPGTQYAMTYTVKGAPAGLFGSKQTFTLGQNGVTSADFVLTTDHMPMGVGGDSANGFNGGYGGEAFGPVSLSIKAASAPASAVPEPATWGLMLFGFGVAGAALRRRRRNADRFALV